MEGRWNVAYEGTWDLNVIYKRILDHYFTLYLKKGSERNLWIWKRRWWCNKYSLSSIKGVREKEVNDWTSVILDEWVMH